MAKINYIVGDATRPQGEGNKLICHCCNNIGGWGSGFVLALSKRWKLPEQEYRKWSSDRIYNKVPFKLGETILVPVDKTPESQVWVANIIGQHRTIATGEKTPVRYDAIASGLEKVVKFCQTVDFSVHMPRMGAGLAQGDWSILEAIIQRVLVDEGGLEVTVYDLA